MSKWQAEKAERNRQSVARLNRALPGIFPSAVMSWALGRPFVPPTPRLAINSYWRAHPIRADRLARALAARSGAPSGWTWQLDDTGKNGLPSPAPGAPLRAAMARASRSRRMGGRANQNLSQAAASAARKRGPDQDMTADGRIASAIPADDLFSALCRLPLDMFGLRARRRCHQTVKLVAYHCGEKLVRWARQGGWQPPWLRDSPTAVSGACAFEPGPASCEPSEQATLGSKKLTLPSMSSRPALRCLRPILLYVIAGRANWVFH